MASMQFIRDPGSSSATNDTLLHSHGIVVESATKGPGSVKARVDRFGDLLNRGVAKVIAGSELDHDLRTTRWNDDAREKGKWELDKSQKSPDVSDAGSYALSLPLFSEIGGQQPDANLSTLERAVLAQEAYVRDVLSGKAPKAERPVPLAHLLWNPPPK